MRVAFLLHGFPTVSETFILNQVTGLLDRGCAVTIFAKHHWPNVPLHPDIFRYRLLARARFVPKIPDGWLPRAFGALRMFTKLSGLKTKINSLNAFLYGRQALSLRLLYESSPFINQGPFDVIHVHFGFNAQWALDMQEIGALTGRLVVSFHGYDVNVWPRREGMHCYDEVFRRAHALLVSSSFIRQRLLDLGANAQKIFRLPVGVDPQKFYPCQKDTRVGHSITFLTVARLVEVKGIGYSLEAFARVRESVEDAKYWIIGDGPLRQPWERLCEDLGLGESVAFLGPRTSDEVARIMRQADIFVLPSIKAGDGAEEGQGLVLLEAQCSGLPVIGTATGGIRESMLPNETGCLVPERNITLLAECMVWLANDRKIRKRMGEAARTFVVSNFDISSLNDQLLEIYTTKVNLGNSPLALGLDDS